MESLHGALLPTDLSRDPAGYDGAIRESLSIGANTALDAALGALHGHVSHVRR